jgi:hypothetical protein
MTENKIDYYAIAIAWGEEYLKNNTKPKAFKYKQGEILNNDLLFVSVCVERLKHNAGREKQASYMRLRDFKMFIERCKTFVDKII